jgi:hypothetical protein
MITDETKKNVSERIAREPSEAVRVFVLAALTSSIEADDARVLGEKLFAATKCLEECCVILWGIDPVKAVREASQ